jgi:hypothetical protein
MCRILSKKKDSNGEIPKIQCKGRKTEKSGIVKEMHRICL